jgi:hypothetical protein
MVFGTAAFSALLLASSLRADNQRSAGADVELVPQAVFQMPVPGVNVRDPFFPHSSRLANSLTPVVAEQPASADLVLKAISGTTDRPLAMINNHTFEIGEEREVRTAQGRVKVRLIAVDGHALKVTIGVGTETRELRLGKHEAENVESGEVAKPETVRVESPGDL